MKKNKNKKVNTQKKLSKRLHKKNNSLKRRRRVKNQMINMKKNNCMMNFRNKLESRPDLKLAVIPEERKVIIQK